MSENLISQHDGAQQHISRVNGPLTSSPVVWWSESSFQTADPVVLATAVPDDQFCAFGSGPIASSRTPATPASPDAIGTRISHGVEGLVREDIYGNAAPEELWDRVMNKPKKISRPSRLSLLFSSSDNKTRLTAPVTGPYQTAIQEDQLSPLVPSFTQYSRSPHRRSQSEQVPRKINTMTQGILSVDADFSQPKQGFRHRLFRGRKRAPTAPCGAEPLPKQFPRQIYVPTHAAVDFSNTTTSPRQQEFQYAIRQSRLGPVVDGEAKPVNLVVLQAACRESSSRYSTTSNKEATEPDNVDEGIVAEAPSYIDEVVSDLQRPKTSAQPLTDFETFIAKAQAEERARRVSARWSAYQQQILMAARLPPSPPPIPLASLGLETKASSKRDSGYHTHSRHGSSELGFGPKSRESWGKGLRSVGSAGDLKANGLNGRSSGLGQMQGLDAMAMKRSSRPADRDLPPKLIQCLGDYIRPARD